MMCWMLLSQMYRDIPSNYKYPAEYRPALNLVPELCTGGPVLSSCVTVTAGLNCITLLCSDY